MPIAGWFQNVISINRLLYHFLQGSMMAPSERVMAPSLYDLNGHRKCLTADERRAFLQAAKESSREVRTRCELLTYTGCRLSEALELTADRVDLHSEVIVFESLKKRKRGVYRAVPVSTTFLDILNLVHNVRDRQAVRGKGRGHRL